MARFHGTIGFVQSVETVPGVHKKVATEYQYTGDVLRDSHAYEKGESLNDNLNINNRFSIVANDFALLNVEFMQYITWMGSRWKITNAVFERPRIILTIGGVYNGPTPIAPEPDPEA